MLASTRHDALAAEDYARSRHMGIQTCREGVSWLRAEREPGRFDFSSMLSRLHAAREQGVRVIWDLMHFGWPAHVDIFAADFAPRFGNYAELVAR